MTADIFIRKHLKQLVAPDGLKDAFKVLGQQYLDTDKTCLGQLLIEKFVIDPAILKQIRWVLFQFHHKHQDPDSTGQSRIFASAVSVEMIREVANRFEDVGTELWNTESTKGWFTVTEFRRRTEDDLKQCRFYFVVQSTKAQSLALESSYAVSLNACVLMPAGQEICVVHFDQSKQQTNKLVTKQGVKRDQEDEAGPLALWDWLQTGDASVALYVGITHQELGGDGTSTELTGVEPTLWVGLMNEQDTKLDSILDKLTLCEDYLVREYLPIVNRRLLPSVYLDKLKQDTSTADFGHKDHKPTAQHWLAVETFLGESLSDEARESIKPSLRGLCGKTCSSTGDDELTLGGAALIVLSICGSLKLFNLFRPLLSDLGGSKFLPRQNEETAKATLKALYQMCSRLIVDFDTKEIILKEVEHSKNSFSLVLDFNPLKSSKKNRASLIRALEHHFSYDHDTLEVKHLKGGRTTAAIQRFLMLARTVDKQNVDPPEGGFGGPAPITFTARAKQCVLTFWESESWLPAPNGLSKIDISSKQSYKLAEGETALTFGPGSASNIRQTLLPGIVDLSSEGRRESLLQMLGCGLVRLSNEWQEKDQDGAYRIVKDASPNVLLVHWTHRAYLTESHPPVIYFGGDGPIPDPITGTVQGTWIHRLIGDANDVASKLSKEALLDAFHYVMSENVVSDRECPSLLKPGYDPAIVLKNLHLKPAT